MFEIILIFLTGFISGIIGSMLGIGGGFIIVPLLVLFAGLPMHVAVGLSLTSIVMTSITSSSIYASKNLVNFKVALILETITILGSITGSHIAIFIPENILKIIFGIVLTYASIKMIFPSHKLEEMEKNKFIGFLSSFFAGMASGMLGIGGGTLKVPIMVLLFGLPMKVAVGTSSFMIGLTASAAAITYIAHGLVTPLIVSYMIIGIFLGVEIGCRITFKAKGPLLRRIFGIILMIFALRMLLSGLGVFL